MKEPDKLAFQPYIEVDADLIPLYGWNKLINGKQRGKTPINNNWTIRDKAPLPEGHTGNVGYRIRGDLVVDVDPRNGGLDSWDSLKEIINVEKYHVVNTGGEDGGFHIYMKLPSKVSEGGYMLRSRLNNYPGIDFKSSGQVVLAGSLHPDTAEPYYWDDFTAEYSRRALAPATLLKELAYKPAENKLEGFGSVSTGHLEYMLGQLDVEEFGDNDSWMMVMMSAHHGTGGEGLEEFVEWSLQDALYDDQEDVIRARWNSLSLDGKLVYRTVGTLYGLMKNRGLDTKPPAQEDFKNLVDDESIEEELDGLGKWQKEVDDVRSAFDPDLDPLTMAEEVGAETSDEELDRILRLAITKGGVTEGRVIETLAKRIGCSKAIFSKRARELAETTFNDIGRLVADRVLRDHYINGEGLAVTGDNTSDMWYYTGTHWKNISKMLLEKQIQEVVSRLREETEMDYKESTLVSDASLCIRRSAAKEIDYMAHGARPRSIVNCLNGEVHLSIDGTYKLLPHNPQNKQTRVLGVEYDPGAKCPKFDAALKKCFSNFKDGEDMERHFLEFMGFVIDPLKTNDHWFMLKGEGHDGKSTFMKILSALLGTAARSGRLDDFRGGNSHASAELVGKLLFMDDDVNYHRAVPSDFVKSMTGNGNMSANPKNATPFSFVNTATLVILTNGYPKIKEVTHGFTRRPKVIPFDNPFQHSKEGFNPNLANEVIEEELAGILNKTLEGWKRYMRRGGFKDPVSCTATFNEWIGESSNTVMFANNCLEKVTRKPGEKEVLLSLADIYQTYQRWAIEHGIRDTVSDKLLKRDLESRGFKTKKIHNRIYLASTRLLQGEFEDVEFEEF